jgi:pimeloyl-ACP methyl ester carboxylesterase
MTMATDIAVQQREMTVDGRRLAYLEAGTGAPGLVALHGIGSSARSWTPVLPRFAAHFHMLAWDLPGYGGSDPLGIERPSASDYAPSLDRLVDQAGGDPVFLLGHSLGALMGAAYARRHPDRVRGLVLADPGLGGGMAPNAPWPESVKSRITDLQSQGAAAFAAARAPRLCAEGAPRSAVEAVEREMARVRLPGYAQAASALAQGNLAADLAVLDCPVRILVGAEDRITPPGPIIEKAETIGLTVTLMPGVGHAGYVEDPAGYADAVLGALGAMA